MRSSIAFTASIVLLAVAGSVARADFININLGAAGPSGYDLGIFVTGPTTMNASNGKTAFNGNLGLGPGSSTNFSGGGTINGNLYVDPTATLQSNFSSQFNVTGKTETVSLAGAVANVQAAAAAAAALTPNQSYGAVGGSAMTLTPSGPLNALGGHDTVVSMSSINITNPSNNLTISGGANDYYIINVTGSVTVSNGEITTSGGIPVSNILFNVEGSGVTLTNGTSVLDGTYLAPNAGQEISISPGTVNGALIGYQIQTSSGPTVNSEIYTPPGPPPAIVQTPAPASVVLVGIALGTGAMGRWLRGRRTIPAVEQ